MCAFVIYLIYIYIYVLFLSISVVPEAPTDLRVEEASSRSLVLSWKPPTMDEQGHSNGTKVIGYRVRISRFIGAYCS